MNQELGIVVDCSIRRVLPKLVTRSGISLHLETFQRVAQKEEIVKPLID
jgi:hypothetical protein